MFSPSLARRRIAVAASSLLVVAGAALVMPTPANAYSQNGSITTPFYTSGIAISPDGSTAYIAQGLGLTVADTATNQVLANIGDLGSPNAVAVSPDGSTVYTSDYSSSTVNVIDAATRTKTGTLEAGPYGALVVSPDGQFVFQANYNYGTVTGVQVASGESGSISVGGSTQAIAISPDGRTLYVGSSSGVAFIDDSPGGFSYVNAPSVYAMALSADGSTLYTVSYNTGELTVIDTATRTATTTTVASRPVGVAVSPDEARIYIYNQASAVIALDATTLTTVASVPQNDEDGGPLAISPDGLTGYVVNRTSYSVTTLDLRESPAFTASTPTATATVGTAYSYTFAATGRPAPTFTASAPLPDGLTLSPEGVLSGIPTRVGTFTFTVTASNGLDPVAVSEPITITVAAAAVIPIPSPTPTSTVPVVPAATPTTLAATGADATAPLLGALLILGAGAVLLFTRRSALR